MNAATTKLVWKRVRVGRQESTCGRYAVEIDGLPRGNNYDVGQFVTVGGQWGAISREFEHAGVGDVLEWYPTMKEAKAHCQHHADRAARNEEHSP